MKNHFGITNSEIRHACCNYILNFSQADDMEEKSDEISQSSIRDERWNDNLFPVVLCN